jgi:hypothetical protein
LTAELKGSVVSYNIGLGHSKSPYNQDNLDESLPLSKFNHNNHVYSSISQTPFMVDTSQNPCMGFEPQQPKSMLETVNNFMDHIVQGLEEAKAALKIST